MTRDIDGTENPTTNTTHESIERLRTKERLSGNVQTWLVVVPWLFSLLTAIVGIVEFVNEQQTANKRPFLERQLEVVLEASNDASILATTSDRALWARTRDDY